MSQRLGRTFLRSRILLSLLLILLPCVTDFAFLAAAKSPPDVHILDLLYETWENPQADVMAYKHGFNASLWSRSFTLAGRHVHMTSMSPSVDAVASAIDQAAKKHSDVSLVLGPTSAELALAALPALRENNLTALGPMTVIPAARIWNPHFYFFRIGVKFSAYTLLRHAVINLRVRRIGFMYTTHASIGDHAYAYAVKLMHGMGRELCGVFRLDGRVPHKADDDLFKKEWEPFAATRPQAVIIMGVPNSTTEPFVHQMMKDPRTNSAYLMAPAMLEGLVLHLWEAAKGQGAHSFHGQVITTASYPAPTDTSSDMIKTYRSVMMDYLEKSGQTMYDAAKGIPDGRHGGSTMLAGWIAGEILSQAISDFNPSLGRKEFLSSLFNQRTYFIGDIAVGTFGDDIRKEHAKAGAVVRCNEGGITAHLKRFSNATTSEAVPEGDFSLSLQVCQGDNLTLSDPAGIVMVNLTDWGPSGVYITNEVITGLNAGFSFDTREATHDMTLKVLQSPDDDVTRVVQKEQESHWTNIVTGSVRGSTMDIPNLAFIDPLPLVAQLNKFRRNVIFLSPTVEQQLFVLAEYVASLPDQIVRAVIRSKSAQDTLDVLKKSLLTFGVKLNSSVLLKPDDDIDKAIGDTGLTIMIEVDEPDIPIFVKHLEQNPNARVVVLFNPFAIFYDMFCAAFNGTAAADRLLIITNMPHWADVHSSSTLIRNYHKSIRDPSAWSPLSLQNFIVGRAIRNAVNLLPVVNWSSVIQYFYSSIAVPLDDMSFGPFSDTRSVTCTSNSKLDSLACAKNFGATFIRVWSMSRAFDPSVPTLFGPVNPSMVYIDPSAGLTRAQLIGLIVGSVVGASVLIAALVLLLYCLRTDNANAPKNFEDPVTIVFTDIQSSTALWAEIPEIMPEAVATHHRLIRRLIAKYRCYEVKTIGDSFMIACKSASAAVHLVGDLQRTFLQHDWGTSAIDQAYHEFEERQAEEDADYEPPTARLDAAVCRAYWNGLRVRAGVHTGLSDIRHDEVTKRYDYYGSTSNTAARTESVAHGGQVLLTGAAYMALSAAERAGLDVTALGPVELRGVPEPVEVYQLNAVPGRAFAKLRLGREELVNAEEFGDQSTEASSHTDNDNSSDPVVFLLCVLFKRLKPKMRLKLLQPLCDRWGIGDPRHHTAYSDDKLCNALISQLAQRVAGVADKERCNWSEVFINARRSLRSSSYPSKSSECSTETSFIDVQCLNPWLLERLWEE